MNRKICYLSFSFCPAEETLLFWETVSVQTFLFQFFSPPRPRSWNLWGFLPKSKFMGWWSSTFIRKFESHFWNVYRISRVWITSLPRNLVFILWQLLNITFRPASLWTSFIVWWRFSETIAEYWTRKPFVKTLCSSMRLSMRL